MTRKDLDFVVFVNLCFLFTTVGCNGHIRNLIYVYYLLSTSKILSSCFVFEFVSVGQTLMFCLTQIDIFKITLRTHNFKDESVNILKFKG